MAKRFLASIAALSLIVPLFACATDDSGKDRTGEQVGTIVGAIGGALLGSRVGRGNVRTLGAVAGGIAGAWAGGRLGRMFDERDRQMQKQAAESALDGPVGKAVSWSNPESGNSGSVKAVDQSTRPADGATCRTFEQSVKTKDGRIATEQGTACRAPDGTWQVAG